MSVTISDIDPAYTAGDALRRRAEIIQRLTAEGIINLNRELAWPFAPTRVAVISARGAAGYGDFVNQLFTNDARLRFEVKFFPAVMQGENTVSTVLGALNAILLRKDDFDAVVVIRGGGSTSDLAAFDSYELASAIALFPLPVIIGIGHERDVTALDYVANRRVNTPTAAAEFLIDRVNAVLQALGRAADRIYRLASERISANRELLARASASLPGIVKQSLMRHNSSIDRVTMAINTRANYIMARRREQLNLWASSVVHADTRLIERNRALLDRWESLLKVLSPDAVLARGFTLTLLPDGKALRNPDQVDEGTELTTLTAHGKVRSTVIK